VLERAEVVARLILLRAELELNVGLVREIVRAG